ncbi:MAG: hypothetical protein EXQ52_17745 [Bryobacterales bacterium]|nr:hypothetical protein [Bryobacterales bacterium]
MNISWIAVPCFGLLAVAFGLLVRSFVSWKAAPSGPVGNLDDFSAARYQPMERLLAENDYSFLAAQRGLDPKVAKRLRGDRRRIFRGYLREMHRDFARVYGMLSELMLHSTEDRPDLAVAMLRQKWSFTTALARVEVRLFVHQFGLGSIEVSELLRAMDTLSAELRHFAMPAAQISAA